MYAKCLNMVSFISYFFYFIYFFILFFFSLTDAGGICNLQRIVEEGIKAEKTAFEGDCLQVKLKEALTDKLTFRQACRQYMISVLSESTQVFL